MVRINEIDDYEEVLKGLDRLAQRCYDAVAALPRRRGYVHVLRTGGEVRQVRRSDMNEAMEVQS